MRHAIRQRWVLVVLLLAVQLMVLLGGLLLFVNWLEDGVHHLIDQPRTGIVANIDSFLGNITTIGIVVAVFVVAISALLSWGIVRRYELRLAAVNQRLEEKVQQRTEQIERSRTALAFGLAKLAESRDDTTGKHLERICAYVELLAREIAKRNGGPNEAWVRQISAASALHDIGKVGVPDRVLNKPGKLDDNERREIEKHPYIGGDTMVLVKQRWGEDDYLVTASQIIFGHHERWDGKGYPFKLKGEQIPLAARIVAVADVYDALTNERPYKQAMSHADAATMIRKGAGSQFDPRVVEAFDAVSGGFNVIREREKE